jgi:uncharacterized protein YndB with AHSA1/START domain/DNA-binding transcriptional ArsR family regulator
MVTIRFFAFYHADRDDLDLTPTSQFTIFNHMVKYSELTLDYTFRALADQTRRRIIDLLRDGPKNVMTLASHFQISLPAVSKHLRVLEKAAILKRTRKGRVHLMSLSARPLMDASEWIESYRQFWEGNLDSLEQFVLTQHRKELGMAIETQSDISLEVKRQIQAPVASVYGAWSNAISSWFGPEGCEVMEASFNPVVGESYSIKVKEETMGDMTVQGVFKEVVPNDRLVFTWAWVGEEDESLVTVGFREVDGSTELTLTHTGFSASESRDHHMVGWEGTLEKLAASVE